MSLKAILIDLGNVLVFFDRYKVAEHFAAITRSSEEMINFILNKSAAGQAWLEAFEEGKIGSVEFKNLMQQLLERFFS